MDNPLLVPIAGGLVVVLLLALLVGMRRRARRASGAASDAPGAEGHEHDEAGYADGHDEDDTDLVPMVTYREDREDREDVEDRGSADGELDDDVERPEPIGPVDADDAAYDAGDDAGEDGWGEPVAPGPEPVNVRYLRAQVRTLQEALERQDVTDAEGAEGAARFRRQVTAALRGLGERTREDESPERTLARVVAAIERLEAPDEVARPVLPTVKFDLSGAQMTLAGPQFAVAPAALAQAPVVTGAVDVDATPQAFAPAAPDTMPTPDTMPAPAAAAPSAPVVTTPLASALAAGSFDDDLAGHASARGFDADPFATDEELLPPPAEPAVVLPVPPPTSSGAQRSRRWSRRATASRS